MRGQRHAPATPYPQERPGTHSTGGWVVLTAGLDWCGKSRPTGIRSLDRPARRQSLYRLRYPALILYYNITVLYYNITVLYYNIILRDHRRKCGPSLTERRYAAHTSTVYLVGAIN